MRNKNETLPELRTDRSAEDLPEGVLKSNFSLDGIRIYLSYYRHKGYVIEGRFQTWCKCKHLHQAEIIFELLSYSETKDFKRVIKLAKQQERQAQPYYDILYDSPRWLSLKHRHDCIVRRVLRKLDAAVETVGA